MNASKFKDKTIYIDKNGNKINKKIIWIKPIEWFENENGCFICSSHKKDKGYARIRKYGKQIPISRYMYEECFGFIPKGMVIRHKCDNPSCINPEHLELGTHQDNMNDMVKRNRSQKGKDRTIAKLKEDDIKRIKKEYSKGKSSRELAKIFNVDKSSIMNIINKKTWRHIK